MATELQITYPDGRVETLSLSRQRSIIGRGEDADIRVVDSRISRHHCAIEMDGPQLYVTDLGGSNGTWVGKTKLLANVREPFPTDGIVYVGPAQLRRVVTQTASQGRDALESQVFQPVAPSRSSGSRGSGGRGSRDRSGTAVVDLDQRRIAVGPGERMSVVLHISNQGKTVDHYNVRVNGIPKTWVTLPSTSLELLPRQEGTVNIDFHPPRNTRTSAGIHRFDILLVDQIGNVITQSNAELDIQSFDNISVDVRPNPYSSRSGGTLTLTVENNGNAVTDYRVDVIDPTDNLEIMVEPPSGNLAPQQERQNMIRLRPRKRNWIGEARRMPLTVTVSTSQQSVDAMPVYTQLSTIPRWLPVVFAMACCVILPFMAIFGGPPAYDYLFPTETVTATPLPTETPLPTVDVPATLTTTFCGEDLDGDGLTNCEEEELKTEVGQKDSDNDGLDDGDEVSIYGTNPLNHDTDGDGIKDGDEVNFACPGGGTLSPNLVDTDGDGENDGSDAEPCSFPTQTPTPEALPTPVPNFAFGAHMRGADDPDAFAAMNEARMDWVKIQLRFSPGDNPASATQDILALKSEGFMVLVGLLGHKEHLSGGGGYYNQFGDFAAGIAAAADGIEVWNEPNIEHEWPAGQINPAEYTELLRVAYGKIKAANPRVLVISAAPAPTGVNDDTVMSDDRYIQGMVQAGAKNYMDCVGIHFNAGATTPDATSGHPADSNGHYTWYLPTMIETYWAAFNSEGPEISLCFTEFGYVSPDGFSKTLVQAGAANFSWGESITEFDQAIWLADALQRTCLSGKVRMMIVWNINFTGDLGPDPQAGYAIIRPDGSCPACGRLAEAVSALRSARCMQ